MEIVISIMTKECVRREGKRDAGVSCASLAAASAPVAVETAVAAAAAAATPFLR